MTVHTTDYTLGCQEPWFDYLRDGRKTVEGRLSKGDYTEIKAGDQIQFDNKTESFIMTVTKVQHFVTLTNYLETVGLQNALPGITTIEEGCAVYLKFYTQEDIEKYGIQAFWVHIPSTFCILL